MENDRVGGRIRAFRKLKGLTQQELAAKIDVSVSVVGSVERGSRKADMKMIKRISEALGIDKEELLGESRNSQFH